jgi:hypothetical protein
LPTASGCNVFSPHLSRHQALLRACLWDHPCEYMRHLRLGRSMNHVSFKTHSTPTQDKKQASPEQTRDRARTPTGVETYAGSRNERSGADRMIAADQTPNPAHITEPNDAIRLPPTATGCAILWDANTQSRANPCDLRPIPTSDTPKTASSVRV